MSDVYLALLGVEFTIAVFLAGGIRVDDASPTIEENEIFGNGRGESTINAEIMVWSAGSAPVIRRNRVHDCPGSGIAVVTGAAGTIEANEIFGNVGSGIHVWNEGSARFAGTASTTATGSAFG